MEAGVRPQCPAPNQIPPTSASLPLTFPARSPFPSRDPKRRVEMKSSPKHHRYEKRTKRTPTQTGSPETRRPVNLWGRWLSGGPEKWFSVYRGWIYRGIGSSSKHLLLGEVLSAFVMLVMRAITSLQPTYPQGVGVSRWACRHGRVVWARVQAGEKHDPDVNRMMAVAGHHQRLFVRTDLAGTQLSSLSGGTPPHRMQAGKAGIPIFPSSAACATVRLFLHKSSARAIMRDLKLVS